MNSKKLSSAIFTVSHWLKHANLARYPMLAYRFDERQGERREEVSNGSRAARLTSSRVSRISLARISSHRSTIILTPLVSRERENAGLNVTCASRVFLLESVVQHSFEIQGTTYSFHRYCLHALNRMLIRPFVLPSS